MLKLTHKLDLKRDEKSIALYLPYMEKLYLKLLDLICKQYKY